MSTFNQKYDLHPQQNLGNIFDHFGDITSIIGDSLEHVKDTTLNVVGDIKDGIVSGIESVTDYIDSTQHLTIGNPDKFIAWNSFGSFGGTQEQGLIPDANIVNSLELAHTSEDGVFAFNAALPTHVASTVAQLIHNFDPLPLPGPLPTPDDGVGITGVVGPEGAQFKVYDIIGKEAGIDGLAGASASAEAGLFLDLQWEHNDNIEKLFNDDRFGIRDLFTAKTILKDADWDAVDVDFKAYVQVQGGVDVGPNDKGPNGQIEITHDIDNGIATARDFASDLLDGIGGLFDQDEEAPADVEAPTAVEAPADVIGVAAANDGIVTDVA
ncbi:hypothetical protein [Carnimonas bestiolae]|uniref:hypothetical protein n=1 Tax=Carnimonas bestiolae TaxID=3402172 RepID=UPI003EDC3F20